MIPGEIRVARDPIPLNRGPRTSIEVTNTSRWSLGVGSHFHFFEVNRELVFERQRAYGMRLDVPAGAIVWFATGESRTVSLVPFAGARQVWGFNGLVNGPLEDLREQAFRRARELRFIAER